MIGIYDHEDAARLAYFGLYAQQHRGQESTGIVTLDEDGLHERRAPGLVPDVYSEADLQALTGRIAIGHVRYGGRGHKSSLQTQPYLASYKGEDIVLAQSGKLVNAKELRAELENEGAIFYTATDPEIFTHLLVRALRSNNLPDAISEVCSQVRGSYSLLILIGKTMIAVRDPHGIQPLAMGKLDGKMVFACETCAFDLLEADFIRPVDPGKMIIVNKDGAHSEHMSFPMPDRPHHCIFELVYFARPDSIIFNEQVYLCRKQMGWQLAHESTPDVDFVMPFPDSGVYSAVGFAQCAELPYEHAMIRNHYVGRTFIQPTQSMRNFGVRVKINPVRAMIEGKKICIVDDSIVRGTTMMTRVKKLRELGAKEVHIRISCPPVKFPCHYGVDFSTRGELIAAQYSIPEIQKRLDVDSLHYLSMEGLMRSVMHSNNYCTACFDGDYPVPCAACNQGLMK